MTTQETLLQVTAIFLLVSGILMQAFSLWIKATFGAQTYEYIFSVIAFMVFGVAGILLHTMARAHRTNGVWRKIWAKVGYGDSE